MNKEIKKSAIQANYEEYLLGFTMNNQISNDILTPNFIEFLRKRNGLLDEREYSFVS